MALIQKDDRGNWRVKGLPWEELQMGVPIKKETYEKIYGCLCKLKDYEATGLSPKEVEQLQDL